MCVYELIGINNFDDERFDTGVTCVDERFDILWTIF